MKMQKSSWMLMVVLVAAFALAACGNVGGGGGASTTIEIASDGENLAYDKKEFTVPAGQTITLTFKNVSTAQQHNLVIVKGGEDVAAKVNDEGINAGPPDFLPADRTNIIAATKMLGPGGSETLTFTAPAPGTYVFLCTYPAHYAGGMKGVMTVVSP
ncbi:MAG: multicopper oxidase domain-containing protein [Roseiflexus sp.]|jgi:azurin|nr:multicopper oxidase domain-containing protein [Roseiflexus sp.]MBO9334262.1 multicopper oxidase domain-containing protein [Roseiflexus sp.]MBO9364715.1 multicopper oxidase domain-containing protein [Roseiflexus sp.]MBO9383563.1 multicopper oxidase domain-containing protein [Roseiflexus sp.]MBO9389811.1 multicopper oxidase domain-containing protein [Roseiflexus sp.]